MLLQNYLFGSNVFQTLIFLANISCKDISGISYACIFLNECGTKELLHFSTYSPKSKEESDLYREFQANFFGYVHLEKVVPALVVVKRPSVRYR